ncbi:MAG: hypothetical protein WAO52_06870 [Prolixibacteraceae bacterium]
MTNSIRELTEKIYHEGVLKATQDAQIIIAEAQLKAEEILRSANQEKTNIINQAKNDADELKRKSESEIRLGTQKMMSKLKQNIAGLLVLKQIGSISSNAINDRQFVKDMILTIVKNRITNHPGESAINIFLSPEDEKELSGYFKNQLITELNNGLEFVADPHIRSGFKIGPRDGNYLISFTAEDFENYFKSFLKDKTWNLIFNEKNEDNTL